MKRALTCVLLAAIVVSGCRAAAETKDAPVEEKTIPVETTEATTGTIEKVLIYAGQVKPSEQVYVLPKIAGKVAAVHFEVGDRVNKDDVLFEIDDTDLLRSINTAQAQYNSAAAGVSSAQIGLESAAGAQTESTLLQLEAAITGAETGVQNAGIAVETAKIALDNITTSYENAKRLFAAGAMSKTSFADIELGYNNSLANYDKAINGKKQAEDGLKQAKDSYDLYMSKTHGTSIRAEQSRVSQAAASAEIARVSLANAEMNLDDLKVKSPLAGIISAKNVTVGGMAGQTTPAYTVINIAPVEISANVSEELINVISPGMSVSVYINSVREEPFAGTISTISPAAEDVKNTFPVKITLPNADGMLKPGMFAEVHFTKEKSENTIVMPRNTVMVEEASKYVFVAENGIAKKYLVETGIDNGKEIEITGGLPKNALIITKGQTQVSDGEKIKVVN